jgi:hypothetical protein
MQLDVNKEISPFQLLGFRRTTTRNIIIIIIINGTAAQSRALASLTGFVMIL